MKPYDAVIAGGGLSGLSLAVRLATEGWGGRRVLIVDDPAGTPPAGWASWSAGSGPLDAAVFRTYQNLRLYAAGRTAMISLAPYRYRYVRRTDLVRVARELCPGFELSNGRVTGIRDLGDLAEVDIDGRTVDGYWVFDSVTVPPPAEPDARLAFTGWNVHCRQAAFDPAVPTLFDFRVPQGDGARFAYVLPWDERRAMVEVTEFVPRHAAPPSPAVRESVLAGYLSTVEYTVDGVESAVLPLCSRASPRRAGRVIPIGARAGRIKASTGYGYERIQRDSTAIARSLVRYGHPFAVPRPRRRYRLLDAILLAALDRNPAELERAFGRLFATRPAARVLRFLDEDTRLRDELRLIASLPPVPYLRAAVHATGVGTAG